ncbi:MULTISPECIES: ABC transporter ATP-binding protein [unclassified Luteococcus]|uniref:ABC transporter ATP-binding protein n=1 Tax=unclassified Luteococcus TaxID=2639923 RepID=UPI00313B1708
MRSLVQILAAVKELRWYYTGIIVCSVLTAATGLATPFIIKAATDEVVAGIQGHGRGVAVVIWLAVALLAADLANTLISNVGGYLGDVMAARLRARLSQRYFHKLLTLPQRYYDTALTGTIISRLQRSITETTQFLQSFSNNFFPMLITLVASLAITAWYSPWISLLLLAIFPTYMWLTTLTSKKWQRLEGEKNTHVDIAGGRFAEVIGQIRVVKSFVQEKRELASFTEHYDATVGLTRRQSSYWHSMDAARRGAMNVIFFGVYALIFVRTLQGAFTIGVMVLLIQLVNLAKQPAQMMSYLVDTAQRAIAGSQDYFRVMAEPQERPELAAPVVAAPRVLAHDEPMIEFSGASFGYDDGHEVLHDVSFAIGQGERVAFVGESGGGKTTLVSLLLGLYRLDRGEVRVAGHSVMDTPAELLRGSVGVVFQDASLFSGTIRENIAYANPDATDEQIQQAAREANAHGFIMGFEDGYDTLIGERGLKLSGGQKQRIAVARAMLKDAPILVLDEATSALDSKSERLVQEGLDRLMHGRTSVIIAHRLSTIATVDRIVTLRNGRVDEIGSPAELATTGGIYAELLALQAAGSKRDRKKLKEFDITA